MHRPCTNATRASDCAVATLLATYQTAAVETDMPTSTRVPADTDVDHLCCNPAPSCTSVSATPSFYIATEAECAWAGFAWAAPSTPFCQSVARLCATAGAGCCYRATNSTSATTSTLKSTVCRSQDIPWNFCRDVDECAAFDVVHASPLLARTDAEYAVNPCEARTSVLPVATADVYTPHCINTMGSFECTCTPWGHVNVRVHRGRGIV